MREITLRLLWHRQAQFAGYLLAEQMDLGAARGIALRCVDLDFGCKHVTSVLEGATDMAVASPAHMLESAAPDRLRLLLTIQQRSPLIYPARRADGIAELADLAGRTVAVWPGGEDLELRWMLVRAGVPADAVERVPLPDTVGPFLSGEVASCQSTTYHEAHLVAARFEPDELIWFDAAARGTGLLKDGVVASAALCAEEPDIVQAVVDTVLEGWSLAFARPDLAVAACLAARPDMDSKDHARQLADIRALSLVDTAPDTGLGRGLGYPDPAHMLCAREALRAVEGREVCTEGLILPHFWQAAPPEFRRTDLPLGAS